VTCPECGATFEEADEDPEFGIWHCPECGAEI
jgi:ribosomal protein L37AE/L43A